jgi:translation initiation factor IF-2
MPQSRSEAPEVGLSMEQVTVKDLASEFEMKSSVVISELKKIGVWVPSSTTPVDSDIANRIRKRLQMMTEAEQEEKEKKGEKTKQAPASRVRRSIKELGKPRKRVAGKRVEEAEKAEETPSPLAGSLRPRKGRTSTYRKMEALKAEEAPEKIEITIDEEPLIEKVEAELPAEVLEAVPAVPEEIPAAPAEVPEEEIVEAEAAEVEVTAEELPAPSFEEEAEVEVPTPVGAVEAPEPVEVEAVAPPVEAEEVPLAPAEVAVDFPAAEEVEEPAVAATEEEEKRRPKRAVARKKLRKQEQAKVTGRPREETVETAGPRRILFSERVTVKNFAELTGIKSAEIIRALMQQGVMATMNQLLDPTTVEKLCATFEIVPQFATFEEVAAQEGQVEERPEDLVRRAPVVTVMGHVDHGKTTLLDHIRHTKVAEGEAGGITQHIGAYQVWIEDQKIVFIDTPGHEAFTRMRARGAHATDIVVLVVAADDGVMPQTLEAIDHANAAKVPIVVAVNKIDKPGCQPDRVKKQLGDRGLVPEDWGGDTIMINVSATEGTNVEQLLEMILLVAELQELKANPKRAASGVILEAKMEKGRGAVATLLVQNGTLRVGDIFIAGSAYGRVRAMFDDKGEALVDAGPSSALEVLGLQGLPQAGDVFQVVEDQAKAREMVEFRQEKTREQELTRTAKVSLDDLYAQLAGGEVKELGVVLKADTQGSAEVLEDTLLKLTTGKVKITLIHRGVGAITESDVLLASASRAIVIGFNVRPEPAARAAAEQEDVEIRLYGIIYDVSQDVRQAMLGLLEPTIRERYLGRAEVRETFRIPKVGTVAGGYVQDGSISRAAEVRLLRDNVVVYAGKLASLKRFKDDVNEVKTGYECGISIANFNDVKVGDVIEAFVKEEVAPQLN